MTEVGSTAARARAAVAAFVSLAGPADDGIGAVGYA